MIKGLDKLRHLKVIMTVIFACLLINAAGIQTAHSSIYSYSDKQQGGEVNAQNDAEPSTAYEDSNSAYPNASTDDANDTSNLESEIPGVGAFFGRMLDSLASLSNSSEGQFRALALSFPLVFPDLYKVFITL